MKTAIWNLDIGVTIKKSNYDREEREKNKREIKSGKKRSFRPTMV